MALLGNKGWLKEEGKQCFKRLKVSEVYFANKFASLRPRIWGLYWSMTALISGILLMRRETPLFQWAILMPFLLLLPWVLLQYE